MAEPITEVATAGADAALLVEWRDLWSGPGRAEAIEHALDLLRALDERGMLDAGRALLRDDPAASRALTGFLHDAQSLRIARNLRALAELLSVVDLDRVGARGSAADAGALRPMGLLELRRRLRDPDVSAGVHRVLDALAEIGRATRPRTGGGGP
jgi:uncharacterized protein YjgD (DUF1641 family)